MQKSRYIVHEMTSTKMHYVCELLCHEEVETNGATTNERQQQLRSVSNDHKKLEVHYMCVETTSNISSHSSSIKRIQLEDTYKIVSPYEVFWHGKNFSMDLAISNINIK